MKKPYQKPIIEEVDMKIIERVFATCKTAYIRTGPLGTGSDSGSVCSLSYCRDWAMSGS